MLSFVCVNSLSIALYVCNMRPLFIIPSATFMSVYSRHNHQFTSSTSIGMSGSSKVESTKSRRLYSFEEARKIARGHGFDSKDEFIEYECAGAYQLPKDADVVWKDDWNGWEDFLGVILSFEEGRNIARKLEVNTEEDYLSLIKSKSISDDDIASRLPYRPDLKYKEEWNGWNDFLIGS